jgi:hypothetical protein
MTATRPGGCCHPTGRTPALTGLVLRKKGTQTITLTDTLKSSLTGSVVENVL